MKKSFCVLLLLLAGTFCFAQETEKQYSHGEVAAIGFVPYSNLAITLGTYTFIPQKAGSLFISGMSLLGNIPACITNFPTSLSETAMEAGTMATSFALYKFQDLAQPLFNIGWKTTWWTQFDGYQQARSRCDFYPEYENLTLKNAILASYNPDVLKRKEVWIPVLAGSAVIISSAVFEKKDRAVWNTGKAYFCGKEVPVALGISATALVTAASMTFTAVGEEAMFRGIGYEEFKVSFGKIPATILDSVIFSAVHIPQEIIAKKDFSTIAGNFTQRALIALILEYIYDKGGLKSSIAFHMWFNTINTVTNYLLTGGESAEIVSENINGTDINIGCNPNGLSININMKF